MIRRFTLLMSAGAVCISGCTVILFQKIEQNPAGKSEVKLEKEQLWNLLDESSARRMGRSNRDDQGMVRPETDSNERNDTP